jgi:hypothetical protein
VNRPIQPLAYREDYETRYGFDRDLQGYDFLEGIRNINAWTAIKEKAEQLQTKVFVAAVPIILNALAKQAGLIP